MTKVHPTYNLYTNAAYLVAQVLRDMDVLSQRPSAADSDTRVDRLLEELGAREDVLEARFHAARGRSRLASGCFATQTSC
jgi:hypothetical protein